MTLGRKTDTNIGALGDALGAGSLTLADETGTATIPPNGSLMSSS